MTTNDSDEPTTGVGDDGRPSDDGYEPTRALGDEPVQTDSPPPPPPLIGAGRHLLSLVAALVLTPVALILMDHGYVRWSRSIQGLRADTSPDARALAAVIAAAVILLVVALLAKLSPLGPIIAGLVWGAAPWVAVTFFPRDVLRHVTDLPNLYSGIGDNVVGYGFVLYAAVTALLVGAGFGASWRRSYRAVR